MPAPEAEEDTSQIVSLEAKPRGPSRASADAHSSHSSRSVSPFSGPGANGKSYMCNQCGREYASTDAVRKHARQNHPEWLKDQGQGCPSLYCTVIEGPSGTQQAVDGAASKSAA